MLAPIASTGLGAIVIWWRTPTETGNRLRRADAISEHQALLRALAEKPTAVTSQPGMAQVAVAEHPDR